MAAKTDVTVAVKICASVLVGEKPLGRFCSKDVKSDTMKVAKSSRLVKGLFVELNDNNM